MKIGIFVGSFDPYTLGHDSILRRALPLFDKIIIGVGVNEDKTYMYDKEQRKKAIQEIYQNEPKVEVKTYDNLTIDFAKKEDASFIIKGVRNTLDFEYERQQAEFNLKLGNVETLLLLSEPQYENISSSMVRELIRFGKDVKEYLPKK
ncbi:MAG: pantetheine-phosphate adenylyltransferase [Prevotella sp.]|nr:pantetheine-phosphate adenylyltransferase [Prevotella sp.]